MDDEEQVRTLALRMLERLGFEAEVFRTGGGRSPRTGKRATRVVPSRWSSWT